MNVKPYTGTTAADEGPIGTATGFFTGSLLGLLGGPVGLAVGALTGTVAGIIFDVTSEDVNLTFAGEISDALQNGKTAVVAEIDEEWTVPVDAKLQALDAIIFRKLRYEVAEDQLARESKAIEAEFKQLQKELKESGEDGKAAINAAIGKLRSKALATSRILENKARDGRAQFEAKIQAMEQQVKDAGERKKAKIQKRLNGLKEEYRLRSEKLQQASALVSQALAPKAKLIETV